jgi:hypothetical protein
MKASELRMSNLVYFNGNHKEIGVISEIKKNYDLSEVCPYKIGINHRVDIYYDIDKLQPIELTEEILLKCENEFTTDFRLEFKNNRLHILFCEKWLLVCDYLHEYQNAHYILTNEELTINL